MKKFIVLMVALCVVFSMGVMAHASEELEIFAIQQWDDVHQIAITTNKPIALEDGVFPNIMINSKKVEGAYHHDAGSVWLNLIMNVKENYGTDYTLVVNKDLKATDGSSIKASCVGTYTAKWADVNPVQLYPNLDGVNVFTFTAAPANAAPADAAPADAAPATQEPAAKADNTPVQNPKTGDAGIVSLLLMAASTAVAGLKLRKK